MDLQLVREGVNFSRRHRKWLVLLSVLGASGYGAYKVYHLPSVTNKRKRFVKILGAFISLAEMVSDSAETVSVVSKDIKQFLSSDSDQVPRSLRQISKIVRSHEFSESLAKVTEVLTVGIVRGYKSELNNEGGSDKGSLNPSVSDRVFDRIFSAAGTGFASVVVGSLARNWVVGIQSIGESVDDYGVNVRSNSSDVPGWVRVICDDRCRGLIANCIEVFVNTAVSVYLDKTRDVNFYDEIFTGLTNPKHQNQAKDILASLCNCAVETLVRTSHQVLTHPSSSSCDSSTLDVTASPTGRRVECFEQAIPSAQFKDANSGNGTQDSGWIDRVSSTLAVPENRKFVLDVTGRVTFETVRSVVEFLLQRITNDLQRGMGEMREQIVEKGLQVIRVVGAKSSVIITLCLALYLHILGGTRILVSA